jgi:hypothetical protein
MNAFGELSLQRVIIDIGGAIDGIDLPHQVRADAVNSPEARL